MRIATIALDGSSSAAVVDGDRALELAGASSGLESVREIAAGGQRALDRVGEWAVRQRDEAWRPIAGLRLGPAVPDPGAIYTIGLNYGEPGEPAAARPPRPLIYGKAPTSVVGPGAVISWDRTLTSNVDAEVELGIVIGEPAFDISPNEAMRHVFGYTCINDISSRDPWLDGDQWLLGKSMPGFCPVGPWVVTRDELDPTGPAVGMHHQWQPDPGWADERDAVLDPGDRRVPEPPCCAAAGRPDRDRNAGPAGHPARPRPPAAAGRHRDASGSNGSASSPPPSDETRRDRAMKPATVFLGEMTDPEVAAFLAEHQTVIVPVGSTEQHGPHGPLATDVLIPVEVARRVAPQVDALVAPPSTTGCPTRMWGSPASSTSGSRRSWP